MLALAALFLLVQPPRAAQLLEEIEMIAVSEPPVLGIDTQIRAAEAISEKDAKGATRLLNDAASARPL